MRTFVSISLLALQVSHYTATAAECPLPDDDVMVEDMINDIEDEKTFMTFFDQFQGLSMEEVMACKAKLVLAERRKLQAASPTVPYPAGHNGTAADFIAPCYSLPSDPASDGWLPIGDDDINGDDGDATIDLDFDFSLYGTTWNRLTAHVNGFLSFGQAPNFLFAARSFPVDINLVAPFWSDVDVRFGGGSVWYKQFPGHLAVVWDRAGRFVDPAGPASSRRNTFQVVISDGTAATDNVCFCYVDMDWWSGSSFASRPANVGINNGATREYVQIGRFLGDGTAYDGPGAARDGIDWLDFQGSSILDPPIQGLCFDVRDSSNVPPVATGFPENDMYNVPCGGSLELNLTFATPEVDQMITVTDPTNLAELQGLDYTVSSIGGAESIMIALQWQPQTAGEYSLTFVATDDFTAPASITKTLNIVVESCSTVPPTQECPLEPDCCEDDCCGVGTTWIAPFCRVDLTSTGWTGSNSPGYVLGCVRRLCCEANCCDDGNGVTYDAVTGYCVPTTP